MLNDHNTWNAHLFQLHIDITFARHVGNVGGHRQEASALLLDELLEGGHQDPEARRLNVDLSHSGVAEDFRDIVGDLHVFI